MLILGLVIIIIWLLREKVEVWRNKDSQSKHVFSYPLQHRLPNNANSFSLTKLFEFDLWHTYGANLRVEIQLQLMINSHPHGLLMNSAGSY